MGSRTTIKRLALVILTVALSLPVPGVRAVGDTTPPVGSVTKVTDNLLDQTATFTLAYSDPESGIDHVRILCDNSTNGGVTVPYAVTITVALRGDGSAGCLRYGFRYVLVSVANGDGVAADSWHLVEIRPQLTLDFPLPAVTGQLYTIAPTFPADLAIGPEDVCSWEFRWGSTAALNDVVKSDETYGGVAFRGPASRGYCGAWTFTLPWVPVRQFTVSFGLSSKSDSGNNVAASRGFDGDPFITATVGSTDPAIRASNLAMAYVLPSTYAPSVGGRVTYTLHGNGLGSSPHGIWVATQITTARTVRQVGGSSFSFYPSQAGNWGVSWALYPESDLVVSAYYDPKVRYPDHVAPRTTTPVVRIGTGPASPTTPTTVSWTGSDVGWGIAKYQLQRSVDGGSWRTVALPAARSVSAAAQAIPGHSYRYRVRAVDKAGNIGSWNTGPTVRLTLTADGATTVRYGGAWVITPDPAALGGSMHTAVAAGATATYSFSARGIAWVAPRGPDQGRAYVYLDGVRVATVDLGSPSAQAPAIVFRKLWTAVGSHVIKIRVLGTAGRPSVSVDGFIRLR